MEGSKCKFNLFQIVFKMLLCGGVYDFSIFLTMSHCKNRKGILYVMRAVASCLYEMVNNNKLYVLNNKNKKVQNQFSIANLILAFE